MPTPSGHTRAIRATRVTGTPVYNSSGDKLGNVEDVMLDKLSNEILFAVVSFGGFLGIGEKYHPVPWSLLDYDTATGGYITNLTREQLESAPAHDLDELADDDGRIGSAAFAHYGVERGWSHH